MKKKLATVQFRTCHRSWINRYNYASLPYSKYDTTQMSSIQTHIPSCQHTRATAQSRSSLKSHLRVKSRARNAAGRSTDCSSECILGTRILCVLSMKNRLSGALPREQTSHAPKTWRKGAHYTGEAFYMRTQNGVDRLTLIMHLQERKTRVPCWLFFSLYSE